MRRPALLALLAAAAVALPLAGAPAATAAPVVVGAPRLPVCAVADARSAGCLALRSDDVDARGQVVPQDAAPGRRRAPGRLGPGDIRSAYGLGSSRSGGRTVAVVDAYDDPTAEADLAVYRSRFGLAPCRSADGCFRKVDQDGGRRYPRRARRLGAGDLARPRHGLRDLPRLPPAARRGQRARASPT